MTADGCKPRVCSAQSNLPHNRRLGLGSLTTEEALGTSAAMDPRRRLATEKLKRREGSREAAEHSRSEDGAASLPRALADACKGKSAEICQGPGMDIQG